MRLIPSLLQAIVSVDGEALVLHVGEKPYVVSPTGQVDLASRGLTVDAVSGIVSQLLPMESQRALDEFGAAQYELPAMPEFSGEHFTVVVARGGDDVWAEIRRRRVPDDDRVPLELFGPASAQQAVVPAALVAPAMLTDTRGIGGRGNGDLELPAVEQLWPDEISTPAKTVGFPDAPPIHIVPAPPPHVSAPPVGVKPFPSFGPKTSDVLRDAPSLEEPPAMSPRTAPKPPFPSFDPTLAEALSFSEPKPKLAAPSPSVPSVPVAPRFESEAPKTRPKLPVARQAPETSQTFEMSSSPSHVPNSRPPFEPEAPPRLAPIPAVAPPPPAARPLEVDLMSAFSDPPFAAEPRRPLAPSSSGEPPIAPHVPPPGGVRVAPPPTVDPRPAPAPGPSTVVPPSQFGPPPQPAVVLPLTRNVVRPDASDQSTPGLDRLLRMAAARGASTLYLSSGAQPTLRVDGELHSLDDAPVLDADEIESSLLTLMPERNAEAFRRGVASDWVSQIPDLGPVRCMSFRDHRGPGGVFRMMPARAISADQLGLSREIQSLALESEGLVVIAGPRSSGKRTLMSALVDLVSRTRRDHVIAIETEINLLHNRGGAFLSQREVRGGADEMLAAARAALREQPDVLVLEELRTTALMSLALDAAASGRLVIGGLRASGACGAIDRILDLYPPEHRSAAQLSLAQNLRGVVAQVLLRNSGGGRVAAREVLLNTPSVRNVLAEGKTSQLGLTMEVGRLMGMAPLNDSLIAYVQSGVVDMRDAYHRTHDRAGFLASLKRHGVDTSALERYA
jgi:twitching motility protein PilT